MDDLRSLHVKHIREGLEKIPELRRGQENAWKPTFKAWRDRVVQGLKVVFGEDHDYAKRFSYLSFWATRISTRRRYWSPQDQEKFEEDLYRAERLLSDVIEELEVASPPLRATKREGTDRLKPQVVVNVMNLLSQTTEVQINQVLESLQDLGLSGKDRELAEKHAKELAEEARGKQRWPVLAKSLEVLKTLGTSVYQRVALPLLLEMLKRQAEL